MLSKSLRIRIIVEWFWCRKLPNNWTNLLHSTKDSVKKNQKRRYHTRKKNHFFLCTNSKEGRDKLMVSKSLRIRIILEWFWCRKLHNHCTNLLHSTKDSVKKESKEALLYNKKESFFLAPTPRMALAPSLELKQCEERMILFYCIIERLLILFSHCP